MWKKLLFLLLIVQLYETLHVGFYSLSNVFPYRKHISSKSNISILTICGTSRNIKIIAPSPHFIITPPPLPPILWYSLNSLNTPWRSFYYDPPPPHFKIFSWNTHSHPSFPPPALQLSTTENFFRIFALY